MINIWLYGGKFVTLQADYYPKAIEAGTAGAFGRAKGTLPTA